MALAIVSDYVNQARVLLQDKVLPYRFTDTALIDALNNGRLEMMRLRPDLFFKAMRPPGTPEYYTSMTDSVACDFRYRAALLGYIVGYAQLQDLEENSDARAAAFVQQYTAKLMTLQA